MLRAGGFGVPGRSWFRDTPKMRSCLDKNLSFEKEPRDYREKENFRQRGVDAKVSRGEGASCVSGVTWRPVQRVTQ